MKIKYISYFTIFVLTILSLSNVNSNSLEIDKNVYAGNKDAKVTIKVFSSLTCPYCADFHKNVFVKLKKELIDSNIVRFEHHSFPLDLAALNAEKILRCVPDNEKRIVL